MQTLLLRHPCLIRQNAPHRKSAIYRDIYPLFRSGSFQRSIGLLYIPKLKMPSQRIPYYISGEDGLVMGHRITDQIFEITRNTESQTLAKAHQAGVSKVISRDGSWDLPPGKYTARQIVHALAPLLNSVLTELGSDPPGEAPARQVLIDSVEASLRTETPQSALPIPENVLDHSRREIARQANRIGLALVNYARNVPYFPTTIILRSHCDGHTWTPAAGSLLRGPRSNNLQMQLFNEWQNQMILLRDALLPFENFDDVILVLSSKRTKRGLRDFSDLRERFVFQCLTKLVNQALLVDVSKAFTAPSLRDGGFGFQYYDGLVLPAYLSGCASLHLLQYHPACLDESRSDLLFVYDYEDYYEAPRTEIPKSLNVLPSGEWPPHARRSSERIVKPSLVLTAVAEKELPERFLKLDIAFENNRSVLVDIGQITRGRRYAYHVHDQPKLSANVGSYDKTGLSRPAYVHDAAEILSLPGLVSNSENDWHIIPATDSIVGLALLGKLYPENVITLSEKQLPQSAEKIGKGYGPRFIIYCENHDDNSNADMS